MKKLTSEWDCFHCPRRGDERAEDLYNLVMEILDTFTLKTDQVRSWLLRAETAGMYEEEIADCYDEETGALVASGQYLEAIWHLDTKELQ